ncbi:MAG: hypothetical protein KAT56_12265 [Sedimentisphaerales bacterium]|nr:hypothetical protein [Sedimentisphaerales bacterium]
MWRQLSDILAGIPKLPDEDGQQWRRLWPMLILVILYTLGGLLKKRQSKKSPPPSRPTPTPPRQQTRTLPSYARKRSDHKPIQQSPRPIQQPSKPIPSVERPERPVLQARRPAGPQVTRQPRMAPPAVRPVVQKRPVSRPPKYAAAAALAGQIASDQVAAKRQMIATRKATQLRRTSRGEKKTTAVTRVPAIEPLQQVLRDRDTAAQAIVMAEILGQPLGLRTSGSYEFTGQKL